MNERSKLLRHESAIRRALWPPILAMGFIAIVLLVAVWRLWETVSWVERADRVLNDINRTLRLAIDMETGKRGYFLVGDEALLQPYTEGESHIERSFAGLKRDIGSDSGERARVEAMQAAFEIWHQHAQAEIHSFQADTAGRLTHRQDDIDGKKYMDAVRDAADAFVKYERTVRDQRDTSAKNTVAIALWGSGALTLVAGASLGGLTRKQMRDLSEQYETIIEAEQRVRQRLATTLTSIGDGVLVTDASGHITLINPIAEALTGWTQDEVQGLHSSTVFDIAHEETGELVRSPIAQALEENRIVLLANHTVLKRRDGTQIAIEDSAAPVRDATGKITGVVLVFRDVTDRKRHEAELAEAMARSERVAETLQRSMLLTPSQDTFTGLNLTTLYQPAWDEAQVGGDFYDAFSFWEDRVVLVIGDATGKGLEAAAATSEVKYALRAYLHENDDPGLALTRLNRFLASGEQSATRFDGIAGSGDRDTRMSFISMAVAIVNTKTGAGSCAIAGAEPPLLLSPTGEARETGVPGMMLGADAGYAFESSSFVLEPGDLLAFATDGITEARRGRRDFFGYQGFIDAIRKSANGNSLDQIAASVVAEAAEYAGGRLNDDVCILLAQRS